MTKGPNLITDQQQISRRSFYGFCQHVLAFYLALSALHLPLTLWILPLEGKSQGEHSKDVSVCVHASTHSHCYTDENYADEIVPIAHGPLNAWLDRCTSGALGETFKKEVAIPLPQKFSVDPCTPRMLHTAKRRRVDACSWYPKHSMSTDWCKHEHRLVRLVYLKVT